MNTLFDTMKSSLNFNLSSLRVLLGRNGSSDHLVPEHNNKCKAHSTKVFGWSIEIGLESSLVSTFPITAKELAEYLGIAENSLSRIIFEKQQPRFVLLENIANRLGVEVWQLFRGSDKAVNGFIEYQGTFHRIQIKKGLGELLEKME